MAKMFRYFIVLSVLSSILFTGCQSNTSPEELTYTPCNNGVADGFSCNNVDLYAHVNISELSGDELSDIWAWTDPETGNEYAILGLINGVDIVDVTDPSDPVIIGFIPEPNAESAKSVPYQAHDDGGLKENSPWRDMKVHENTLYIVSEQVDYGLQFFDLTQLRDVENPPVEFSEFGRYTEFGNAHNIFVNEDSEYLYVVGSTTGIQCAENGGGTHD